MKKLFTLVALLACFMGAKAEWVTDYTIDYSQNTGFPFFVMGYVPEWIDGVMTDFGANYRYETQANLDGDGDSKWKDGESSVGTVTNQGGTEYQKVTGAGPYWHQYFIADGIPTEIDGSYTVKALVKASENVTINVNMGWGWGTGEQAAGSVSIPQSDDFVEVEWEYSGIAGTSCNLVAQPGTATATIEWKSLSVSHNQKAQRPTTWQEWITSDGQSIIPDQVPTGKYVGDAEFGGWPSWALETTNGINANWRGDRTGEICAWALTMGRNFDSENTVINEDSPRARPFPADIEVEEGTSNHVFAVHVTEIAAIDDNNPETDDAGSIAWSNQFWLQAPKAFKSGDQVRIKFRYKAEHACNVGTQWHKKNPSDYNDWNACGSIAFTTEWQEFEATKSPADGTWSLAFNLCDDAENGRTPNVFYFDDLSWQSMKLDEGFFVAGCNETTGLEYDFDNAIQFEEDPGEAGVFIATIGETGKPDTYVSQIMISTVRGNDASFKSNTLNRTIAPTNDPDDWQDYVAKSLAKMNLPGSGVWKIWIDTNYTSMAFEMLEGTIKDPIDIVTNESEIIVKGLEREPTASEQPKDEEAGIAEGTGQAWDNQFFIVANRELSSGEATVIKFQYKASKAAKTTTQCHAAPGGYLHWACIGDVNFTEEWQNFEADFTIPAEGNGMKSIAFNMAEIKDACDYEIKNVQWYLKDESLDEGKTWENLINATGYDNFYVKEGAGTNIHVFVPAGETDGINNVATNSNNTVSAVIVNLAGQRVSNGYKGIVIKNGKKVVLK